MIKIKRFSLLIITIISILVLNPSKSFSQISEGGTPPSFDYQLMSRSLTTYTKVPVNFYIKDLIETDNWNARAGKPMPLAKLISVDYSIDNSGYYTTLPGGVNIWRLHLTAVDAMAIMLYYKDFYIPEGGKLFIYSADKSQILGAYTHKTNSSGGLFATEFIGGDSLVLEYVASTINDDKPRICINEIGYGYNSAALREFCGITTRATAGPCMVDINCEEGAAWQNEKNGVLYSVQKVKTLENSTMCTSVLMNNTAEDFKPIILSARHCSIEGGFTANAEDMQQWMFYFHKEREGCGDSFLPAVTKTMTGCSLLAHTGTEGGSDGILVLLNDMIPDDYEVFYNGWDRRDIAALSGVSIHHPRGDNMKISTYNTPANVFTFYSSEFNGDRNAHWNVTFAETPNGHGVTAAGSSGGPLFNENKLVVGTLTGGNSSCLDHELKGLNIYGKLSYHWDKYKTDSSTRMDVWLDPLDLKVETLQGRYNKIGKPSPSGLVAVNQGSRIYLSWKEPVSSEVPKVYNIYRNNIKIGESISLSYIDFDPTDGTIYYSVSAVYANGEESRFTSTLLSNIKYKAPYELKAERINKNDIKISWNAPVYEQTIYWGTTDITFMVGWENDNDPFYYGQKWSPEDISSINENIIKAIQFFPIRGNKYEVYLSQGSRSYKQKIESASLKNFDINTITLNEPFVIDGSKSLIVAIYVSEPGSDYPAACDNGPVVNGKGNICSFDGEEWGVLEYDENEYNFFVSAIITSERGLLTTRSDEIVDTEISNVSVKKAKISPRAIVSPVDNNTVSLRSSVPAPFPELTKFRIYRDGSVYRDIASSKNEYIDNLYEYYPHTYSISAFYGEVESDKSEKVSIVGIENIDASVNMYPTSFSSYVSLKGHEYVSRIEIVSVSGKTCLVVNEPNETIDTSSLSPGIYFFRIFDNAGSRKVIKAVKIK